MLCRLYPTACRGHRNLDSWRSGLLFHEKAENTFGTVLIRALWVALLQVLRGMRNKYNGRRRALLCTAISFTMAVDNMQSMDHSKQCRHPTKY